MKKIFAIYDIKGNCYGSLITCVNEHIALRIVDQLLSDAKSDYRLYPGDFNLVELGVFNSVTGELLSSSPSVVLNLKTRLEYLKMLYLNEHDKCNGNQVDENQPGCNEAEVEHE